MWRRCCEPFADGANLPTKAFCLQVPCRLTGVDGPLGSTVCKLVTILREVPGGRGSPLPPLPGAGSTEGSAEFPGEPRALSHLGHVGAPFPKVKYRKVCELFGRTDEPFIICILPRPAA